MPQVSLYLNEKNLKKLDDVRGSTIKRSTVINKVLDYLDESTLESWLGIKRETINTTQTGQTTDEKTVDAPQDPPTSDNIE